MIPENKVKRLPDYYDKKKGSNNWKILELQRQGAEILNREVELVKQASDVSKATGAGLDVWGSINDVKRNGLDDEGYRIQILIQMVRDMIDMDYTAWYSAVLDTFGCTADEIIVSGTSNPYEYQFEKFPLWAVQKIGLDINTATALIEEILPITGQLLEILYDGGVPVDITKGVGTILSPAKHESISNDYVRSEEMYMNAQTLVAGTGEIYERCEGNFGRSSECSMDPELLSAGVGLGVNFSYTLMLKDHYERTLDAQEATAGTMISSIMTQLL